MDGATSKSAGSRWLDWSSRLRGRALVLTVGMCIAAAIATAIFVNERTFWLSDLQPTRRISEEQGWPRGCPTDWPAPDEVNAKSGIGFENGSAFHQGALSLQPLPTPIECRAYWRATGWPWQQTLHVEWSGTDMHEWFRLTRKPSHPDVPVCVNSMIQNGEYQESMAWTRVANIAVITGLFLPPFLFLGLSRRSVQSSAVVGGILASTAAWTPIALLTIVIGAAIGGVLQAIATVCFRSMAALPLAILGLVCAWPSAVTLSRNGLRWDSFVTSAVIGLACTMLAAVATRRAALSHDHIRRVIALSALGLASGVVVGILLQPVVLMFCASV